MTRRKVNISKDDDRQRRRSRSERNVQSRRNASKAISKRSSASSNKKRSNVAAKRKKAKPYLSTKGAQEGYPQTYARWQTEDERKRQRARERFKSFFFGRFLKIILVLAIIIALAAFIMYYPGFYITTFLIEGTEHVSSAIIMDSVDKAIGEHFIIGIGGSTAQWFGLRYGAIEQHILDSNPILREVRVAFRFPSKIVIEAHEKTEVIALRVTDGYALLDRNFEVIRVIASPQFDLPILEGVRLLEAPEQGKPIAVEDPEELNAVLSITAAMIRQDESDQTGGILLMDTVRKIRQDNKETYYLFIPLEQGGEIRVKLKDNRLLPQKLALLAQLINTWQLKERGTGELDMTGERTVFKPDAAY